jgi:cytochrome c551/c552
LDLSINQNIKLAFASRNGKGWVNLQVGLRCHQPQHGLVGAADQGHGKRNAPQRCKNCHLATRLDPATEDVAGAVENTAKADAIQEVAIEDHLANVEKKKGIWKKKTNP